MTVVLESSDKKLTSEVKKILEDEKAQISEEKKWGEKILSYPINKKANGYYHQYIFTAPSSALGKIRKKLDFEDFILRHLIIKL